MKLVRLQRSLLILLLLVVTASAAQNATSEWKVFISEVTYRDTVKVRHPAAYQTSDENAPADKTFAVIRMEFKAPNPDEKLRLEDIILIDEASTRYPALGISPLSEPPEFSLFEEQRKSGGFSVSSNYSFIADTKGTMLLGSSSPRKAFLLFAVPDIHKGLRLQIGSGTPIALPKRKIANSRSPHGFA